MNTRILTILSVAVVLIACAQKLYPVFHAQPVKQRGVVVASQHHNAVPLKAGGEFRYQGRTELDAFRATNGAALR